MPNNNNNNCTNELPSYDESKIPSLLDKILSDAVVTNAGTWEIGVFKAVSM